jgi:hypothetical protein
LEKFALDLESRNQKAGALPFHHFVIRKPMISERTYLRPSVQINFPDSLNKPGICVRTMPPYKFTRTPEQQH